MDIPSNRRHSIRIREFDYSQPASYFVTICAHQRKSIFGEVILGGMRENPLGEIVNTCWCNVPFHFPGVELHAHIVMPNHFHALFLIRERARRAVPLQDISSAEGFGRSVIGSVPTIVRSFKAAVSKRARSQFRRPSMAIWQRNYFEHVVRNEMDCKNIRRYIIQNPTRWECDEENQFAASVKREPWSH